MNDSKLLYLLPDLAYVVGLLPAKKPNTFAVQSFLQINGQFMDDNDLLEGNFDKLLDRLEEGEYDLVLPDFLFTNTIVNVQKSNQSEVEEYVEKKLLPELGLNKEEHEIKTIVLTGYKGIHKVQLSALEKTVLEPMKKSLQGKSIKIKNVIPLSWTLKSVISLEPSISLVQMGDKVYLAQHYIGIDQTNFAPVAEVETLVETIKTLKGAEPSIQTIYLLSSELVEEKLKEGLSNTLPIQQLTTSHDAESKMPSYVKQAIEAGMRTLSIPEYALPKFTIGKVSPAKKTAESTNQAEAKQPETKTQEPFDLSKAPAVIGDDSTLPKPGANSMLSSSEDLETDVVESKAKELEESEKDPSQKSDGKTTESESHQKDASTDRSVKDRDDDDDDNDDDHDDDHQKELNNDKEDRDDQKLDLEDKDGLIEPQHPGKKETIMPSRTASVESLAGVQQIISLEDDLKKVTVAVAAVASESVDKVDFSSKSKDEAVEVASAKEDDAQHRSQTDQTKAEEKSVIVDQKRAVLESDDDQNSLEVDLSQFADNHSKRDTEPVDPQKSALKKEKMIIRDNSGVNSMVKMFFVGLVSFSLTVAVGVGLGLGVLSLSNRSSEPKSPVTEAVNPQPTVIAAEPTATPTPAPEIKKDEYDVLVVNATKVAGYAGKIGDKLKTGGFTSIKTSNAKGDYDEAGFYVLMPTEDKNLVAALAKDSGLELEFAEGFETEDAKGQYDVVIVLAEE
ncbi:MAG: LytR C-terminal domain-containing protein [Patescibacteria group bacterium]